MPESTTQENSKATAKDLMSKKLVSVHPETTCQEALEILIDKHITGLPVVDDDGILVGVISMFDFLRASIRFPGETTYFDGPQLQRLLEKGTLDMESMLEAFVADFMSRDIITVGPDDNRQHVIQLMREHKIHRVIVVNPEDNRPLGVISTFDLLPES